MEPDGGHRNEELVDFFSQPDSMAPPANPAGMDFSQPETSLVGHGVPLRRGYNDIDLNSQAAEFPHLSWYQEILQSLGGGGADVASGHRGSTSCRSNNSSCGGASRRTPSGRDAAAKAVAPFRAPRIAGACSRGGLRRFSVHRRLSKEFSSDTGRHGHWWEF
uniref:Uncharacterized protein n=1 Tax=Arundo donax TaxID=35708 RepID=A0A0A8XUF1_ARUDO